MWEELSEVDISGLKCVHLCQFHCLIGQRSNLMGLLCNFKNLNSRKIFAFRIFGHYTLYI